MNNDRDNATPESTTAPLTWTRKKEWGSEGLTHRATATAGDTDWKYEVRSPQKGLWRAMGRRSDGGEGFYAEARTLAEAKGLVQDHADARMSEAAIEPEPVPVPSSLCARCNDSGIDPEDSDGGHGVTDDSLGEPPNLEPCRDCGPGMMVATDEAAELLGTLPGGTALVGEHKTDACDTCKGSGADPEDPGDYDSTVHMHNPSTAGPCPTCNGTGQRVPVAQRAAQAAEYLIHFRDTLGEVMAPAVARANRMMRAFNWHLRRRCACPTPSHRMSCGEGGKVRVVQGEQRPVSAVSVIIGQGDCHGPCCGGTGPVNYDH